MPRDLGRRVDAQGAANGVPGAPQCALDASGTPGTLGAVRITPVAQDAPVGDFLALRQTERQFQAQVVRYARLMGWATYHTHDSRRSDAGFPDLVLVRRPRVVWAELKSQRGRLTDAQAAWIAELRGCGQEVHIWRPSHWRQIERVLR